MGNIRYEGALVFIEIVQVPADDVQRVRQFLEFILRVNLDGRIYPVYGKLLRGLAQFPDGNDVDGINEKETAAENGCHQKKGAVQHIKIIAYSGGGVRDIQFGVRHDFGHDFVLDNRKSDGVCDIIRGEKDENVQKHHLSSKCQAYSSHEAHHPLFASNL